MREIKFRVWDYQKGAWAKESEAIESMGFVFGVKDYFNNIAGERAVRWDFMQFTGLHDKNGKEIYEGDILKCKGHVVTNKEQIKESSEDIWSMVDEKREDCYFNNEVQFFSGNNHGWRVKRGRFTATLKSSLIYNMSAEVIGNIHENPKLLK
jgi:uncharacterized phage protein (TIGR01671 family)